jgi:hypothetical protein
MKSVVTLEKSLLHRHGLFCRQYEAKTEPKARITEEEWADLCGHIDDVVGGRALGIRSTRGNIRIEQQTKAAQAKQQ